MQCEGNDISLLDYSLISFIVPPELIRITNDLHHPPNSATDVPNPNTPVISLEQGPDVTDLLHLTIRSAE